MIKIFEEYNKYYSEIPIHPGGMVHLPDSILKRQKFDETTITELKSILKNFTTGTTSNSSKISFYSGSGPRYSSTHINIHRFEDDWFILCIEKTKESKIIRGDLEVYYHKWYKCDQLEGLKRCINDVLS